MTDSATSPASAEVAEAEVKPLRYEIPVSETDAVQAQPEPEPQEVATEGAEPEPEVEDVDYEGKQYKLPRELKEALMRNKDYTQKTQELAAQRRQVEATSEQVKAEEARIKEEEAKVKARAESMERHVDNIAVVKTIDAQLAQFPADATQWAQLEQKDPAMAASLFRQRQILIETRNGLVAKITETESAIQAERQAEQAKAKQAQEQQRMQHAQQAIAVLQKEIPNFSRETVQQIEEFAVKDLGFKPEQVREVIDPRIWIMAYKLMSVTKAAEKQVAAATAKPDVTAKPLTPVAKGNGARGVADPDALPTTDWMKERQAQLRQKSRAADGRYR